MASYQQVFSASVATKKDPRTKEVLSMGFGFITFKKKASSEKALKTMQHSRLADHCLELKRLSDNPISILLLLHSVLLQNDLFPPGPRGLVAREAKRKKVKEA